LFEWCQSASRPSRFDAVYSALRYKGEIFIISNDIIPNARRDDFEPGKHYDELINILREQIGNDISRDIRELSGKRNNLLKKKIDEADEKIAEVDKSTIIGFNSKCEKNKLSDELVKVKTDIKKILIHNNEEEQVKKEILKKIEEREEQLYESSNYKINKINSIGRKEKRVLAIVTDILSEYLVKDQVSMIISEIQERISTRGEKNSDNIT
jgi:molecular chaperone HtpG